MNIYSIFFLNSNLNYILNSHWKQNLYNKALRSFFMKPMSTLGVTKSKEILFYFNFDFSLNPRATLGISASNPYMQTKNNELKEVLFTPNLDGHPLLQILWIRIRHGYGSRGNGFVSPEISSRKCVCILYICV